MLTKEDIFAIRKADVLCMHLNKTHPGGLVRLIKRKSYSPKPFETDQEYILSAKVEIETHRGKTALEAGAAECFAHVGIYHEQASHVSSVLKTLRVGDDVTFAFHPDGHGNGYVAAAGLHADVLYLDVRREGKRTRWEIEISVCPNNSARMCRGVPNDRSYEEGAEYVRKLG